LIRLPILPILSGKPPGKGGPQVKTIRAADIGEPVRRVVVIPRRKLPAPPPEPSPTREPERKPAPRRKKREKVPA